MHHDFVKILRMGFPKFFELSDGWRELGRQCADEERMGLVQMMLGKTGILWLIHFGDPTRPLTGRSSPHDVCPMKIRCCRSGASVLGTVFLELIVA